jgi:hypothetical protein
MTNLWTDANIERLKTLFFENKSMAEIAALIPGSTRNGVIGKLHRLGLRDENREPKERSPKKPRKTKAAKTGTPYHLRRFQTIKAGTDPGFIEQKSPTDGFSFADLEPGMCKWPLGGLYCGMPIAGVRKPYCADHAAKAKRHD